MEGGIKFAIITGSSSGIGLHLARKLFADGKYSIVLACRDRRKSELAMDNIIASSSGRPSAAMTDSNNFPIKFIQLDLSVLKSVEDFVEEFSEYCYGRGLLHLLVNNAGVMNHPYQLTSDGIEIHFATNHLGHFHLTNLLEKFFSSNAKVLNVSSGHYEKALTGIPPIEALTNLNQPQGISPNQFYSISKLANCLHTVSLCHRFKEHESSRERRAVAIRPGFVRGTDLGRHFNPFLRWLGSPLISLFGRSLDEGISTLLHCINCQKEKLESGKLYYNNEVIPYREDLVNADVAQKLWEISDLLIRENMDKRSRPLASNSTQI